MSRFAIGWSRLAAASLALSAVAAAVVSGCGDSSDDVTRGPRAEMLRSLTDEVILPTYRQLEGELERLATTTTALLEAPSAATLAEAQRAWRSARHTWKRSEAFRLGPSEDLQLRIRSKLDWSPIVSDRIEEQIAGAAELTPEYIDTLGANRRGLLAVEYLLFDAEGGDAAVLQRLTSGDGRRRLAFADAVARDMAFQASRLVEAWDPLAGDFRFELYAAGQGSTAFPTMKAAIDTLVGAMVSLAVAVEENKLGRPFGSRSDGVPRPEAIDTIASGSALDDLVANIEGIAAVYGGGGDAAAMQSLVARVSPEIDAGIRDAIRRAKLTVQQIAAPLPIAVVSDRPAVAAALATAKDLRLALSVDLVSAMGATPRFVGDGD